jgi:hypothetical protein
MNMSLIDEMEKEAAIRLDRWKWIGARMAKKLVELYGTHPGPHPELCQMVYHEAACEYERMIGELQAIRA